MAQERTNRPGSSDTSSSKSQRPEDRRNEQRSGGMNRSDKDAHKSQTSERGSSTSKPGSHSGSGR